MVFLTMKNHVSIPDYSLPDPRSSLKDSKDLHAVLLLESPHEFDEAVHRRTHLYSTVKQIDFHDQPMVEHVRASDRQ